MKYFQTASLIIWIAFYGSYFAKMLIQRRKGIRTNPSAKERGGDSTRHVEKMLRRSAYAIAFIQLCSMFVSDPAIALTLPQSARLTGMGVALLGVTVFCIAMYTIRDSWRTGIAVGERTALVTNGVYRYSRNPAFLGFDLFYAGLAVAFCNWMLVFISLMGMILMHLQIIDEEKLLSGQFGDAYQAYRKRTPRYFLFF
ncbi:MAG: isoprenylcysteine carboxylmethyltransferase family protein [Tannerella sp.]|jgi:protein-S-isoprenylcysteine O-methyltransferase Ste14|nr:isoprenylcysteine carboxylmethyltransferase family protein [Tannerella sp.]